MKKNFKKFALMLCFSLSMSIAFTGCSSDSGETKETVTSSNDGQKKDSNKKKEVAKEVTIEEQVLLDHEGIVVTATEYVTDAIWGDGIKLLLENNSDKTVSISCDALIVNNYMISDLFVSEVSAEKKANEVLYLSSSELEAAGIDSVGQIEIYFRIYDSNSYETLFTSDCITIQTSAFADMDTTPADDGTELYNANGIRIVEKSINEDSFLGTSILLYCENSSERNVGISVDEMSINGFMIDSFFATTVYSGKMSFDEITIYSSTLEENSIETIEDVELKFHIYDKDSYETITDSDSITFTAK